MGVRPPLLWLLVVPALADTGVRVHQELRDDPSVPLVPASTALPTVSPEEEAQTLAEKAALEARLEIVHNHLMSIEEQKRAEAEARSQLPKDLQSIANRFDEIDARIDSMKQKFTELQTVALEVNSTANMMGEQLVLANSTLVEVRSLALQNQVKAAAVRQEFAGAAENISSTATAMNTLKDTLSQVEKTTLEMSHASVDVGEKVGELELAVQELLPGREYLPSRITRAQDNLKAYQESSQSGALDPIVASTIRGNFLRAQRRTERMTEDALQSKIVESDTDEDEEDGSTDTQ